MTNDLPTQLLRPASFWPWIVCTIAGLLVGAGSALAISGGALSKGNIMAGRWSSDPNVGAQAANPWLRARIARVGLLGLAKSETLYFDRSTDEAGGRLREACTYRLSGSKIPTRWWSLTIYDGDAFLPRNTDQASSIDATHALADGQSQWSGILSPNRPSAPNLWLSSNAAGTFSVTLRLYNPATIDANELRKLTLPRIELVDCAAAKPAGTG